MARAQDQARWRQRSGRRRVELYLPVETVERLDALAAERGESRAAVMAALVSGSSAAQKGERYPQAEPERERRPDTVERLSKPPQVRWKKVGANGWDAIDELGQSVAYLRRAGDGAGWEAEFIGRNRPGCGRGRTRDAALRDLYQSGTLGRQE